MQNFVDVVWKKVGKGGWFGFSTVGKMSLVRIVVFTLMVSSYGLNILIIIMVIVRHGFKILENT